VALQAVIRFLEREPSLEEVVFVLFDHRTCEVYAETLERLMSGDS
jgi:O-acetyl-ADP-ribose deacetylase (regulator of RNase III)